MIKSTRAGVSKMEDKMAGLTAKEYEDLKRTYAEVRYKLDNETLTAAQRKKLQTLSAALAGQIFSPWLPVSTGRRLIMLVIVILGFQQAIWYENYQPFLWWFLLPFFSPRVVGEVVHLAGRATSPFLRN